MINVQTPTDYSKEPVKPVNLPLTFRHEKGRTSATYFQWSGKEEVSASNRQDNPVVSKRGYKIFSYYT